MFFVLHFIGPTTWTSGNVHFLARPNLMNIWSSRHRCPLKEYWIMMPRMWNSCIEALGRFPMLLRNGKSKIKSQEDTTNKEIMFGNLPTVVPMSHTVVASFAVGKIQFYLLVFPFSMALMCIYVTFILRLRIYPTSRLIVSFPNINDWWSNK
jgi:hypothetical protein